MPMLAVTWNSWSPNAKVRETHAPQIRKEIETTTESDFANREVRAEFFELVYVEVGKMPPKMKEVFELSRVNGLKYSEIAQVLGLSIKTIETQMSRALTRLRKKLASYLQ